MYYYHYLCPLYRGSNVLLSLSVSFIQGFLCTIIIICSIIYFYHSMLIYKQGDLMTAQIITMTPFDSASEAQEQLFGTTDSSRTKRQSISYSTDAPGNVESSYVLVRLEGSDMLTPGTGNEVDIALDIGSASSSTKIYVSNVNTQGTFRELDTKIENGMAIASTNEEGVYVAASPAIAAYITVGTIVFVLLVVVIAVICVIVYFRVRRDKWEKVTNSLSGVSRSFQKKI